MQAYSFPIKGFTKIECVAELMKMYQQLNERKISFSRTKKKRKISG